MLIIVVAVAAILWALLGSSKPASAATGTGVISNPGDFDPATADQLNGAAAGDVSIGDEWTATFIKGNGDWSDAYKTHAFSADDLKVY